MIDSTVNGLKAESESSRLEKERVEKENSVLKNAVQESYQLRQEIQRLETELAMCKTVSTC